MHLGSVIHDDEKRYTEISVLNGKIVFSLPTKSVCKQEKLPRDACLECDLV